MIHGASEMYTAALMPRLQYLIVDHNPRLDICSLDYFIDNCKSFFYFFRFIGRFAYRLFVIFLINHIFTAKLQKSQQWVTWPNLKVLSVSFTRTSRLCFSYMKTESLTLFNISYSRISTLSVSYRRFLKNLQVINFLKYFNFSLETIRSCGSVFCWIFKVE